MRVNYLIAACSARVTHADCYGIASKDMLRMHLEELAKTDTSALAQVTVVRTTPLVRGEQQAVNVYWDIDKQLAALDCPSEIIDVPDRLFSYSSWIQAAQKYRDAFDYYVLIEDDYYPAHKDFVNVLVGLHSKKFPEGGYLNGFTTDIAAVSNGICDAVSFIKGIDSAKPDPFSAIKDGAQALFGPVLFGERLTDYTDVYRTLFNSVDIIEETHDVNRNFKQDIFNPIQYLAVGEQEFRKSLSLLLTKY